jgi:hypothetical protein
MTAAYQNILGNETEFFLLEESQKTWSGLKKIGVLIKNVFGIFGLSLVLLATIVIWAPLLIFGWYYFKKLARGVPPAAKLAIKDDFQNVDWKTLKTLEYRLEVLTIFVKGIRDGMKNSRSLSEKTAADIISVLDSLEMMSKHIKGAYHFKSDNPEIQNAWNDFDDIWNYETPESDKEIVFEFNKGKRSE